VVVEVVAIPQLDRPPTVVGQVEKQQLTVPLVQLIPEVEEVVLLLDHLVVILVGLVGLV